MGKRLRIIEFVALMAIMSALTAFATDAMLPALPQIAGDLSPDAPNRAQMVVGAFMLGLGIGTLVAGPLADAFGRKTVLASGIVLFILGSVLAYAAHSLELLLAARVLQGFGAAGPRIAPMAMIRDLYEGRKMAQTLSFVQMVFMLVPAAAPAIGALIIAAWDWRAVFVAFALFAGGAEIWLHLRQGETLAVPDRRPLKLAALRAGFLDVVSNRAVMTYTAALTLNFAVLVAILSSTQQVYAETFGKAASFPFWFAMTALLGAIGTLLNAFFVVRIGMRRLVLLAFGAQVIVSLGVILAYASGAFIWPDAFAVWFFWTTAVFFMVVLSFGNLYALALQPLGHIAGMGASVTSAISTVVAVFIAVPIGLAFDSTPMPLISGVAVLAGLAWLVIWRATKEDLRAKVEN